MLDLISLHKAPKRNKEYRSQKYQKDNAYYALGAFPQFFSTDVV